MAYVVGGLAGIVWLWFWLRGHWFAAVLGALALGWFPLVDDKWRNEWQLCLACLVVPWVPMLAIPAIRRLSKDFRVIFGKDEAFADPMALEIRSQR